MTSSQKQLIVWLAVVLGTIVIMFFVSVYFEGRGPLWAAWTVLLAFSESIIGSLWTRSSGENRERTGDEAESDITPTSSE